MANDMTMDTPNPSPDETPQQDEGDLSQGPWSFVTMFYMTLFHPAALFHHLTPDPDPSEPDEPGYGDTHHNTDTIALSGSPAYENRYLVYGIIFVMLVSSASPLAMYIGKGGQILDLAFQIPLQAMYGVVLWLSMASFFALMGHALRQHGQFKQILLTTAYAPIPWLLLPPVTLLKYGFGNFGAFAGTGLALALWAWSVVLFAMAIAHVYRLSADRVLILLIAPFTFFLVAVAWSWGFFINIQRILP